ncbi:ATP synthase subunit I [Rossellomorea vietnamensis]|uniref:ATP synthase subunit I n=1 Tax=Rossellomorea vietnamensis TaxID=218284 RepID=A0A5D4M9K7_9BACI|nr:MULTISPECIES: ATP synthase subunit I [Bacillaceae]TYR97695.1 ATP synthase subunit I [Rossellomorea vietnamensis]
MTEIQQMYNRHRKYIFYLLSIYVLGWGFTDYQNVFLGLAFGTAISLFNHWLLVRKTVNFGDKVLAGEKIRSLGTTSRMASAIFAAIIAVRFPESLHLPSVIFGLMTSYLVIMIDYLIQQLKQHT